MKKVKRHLKRVIAGFMGGLAVFAVVAGMDLCPAHAVQMTAPSKGDAFLAPKTAEKSSESYDKNAPVELNGDTMEFKAQESKYVASGNVLLRQNNATLFCDRLEFYRDRQEAHAYGNIVLESDKGTIWADKAFYNFQTKRGEFTNARIIADPLFGKAASIAKVRDNYYVLSNGYLTTSDYDDPEYRIKARKIEVYPGDRAIGRNMTMYIGPVPIMYFPKYVQYLNDNRPHFSVIPGYKKDFGAYVLMSYRIRPLDWLETTYYLDYRTRKGVAWGVDLKYEPSGLGKGLVRTYYMNELNLPKHFWQQSTESTAEHQRYRVEWRHQWDIDPQTNAIWQYFKQTDINFTKEYFPKEYRNDENPLTYFLLTRALPNATASLRTDVRVNRYESSVERLPEINYSLTNQPIADTGFYVKSNNTFSRLDHKDPSPSDNAQHTNRFDTDDEVSRPFKWSFLELRPYVGTEQTYYSRPLDRDHYDSIRGIFRTGMDVSTKFYRLFDVKYNKYGIEINNLRHVVTPTISYLYSSKPTIVPYKLYQYDAIDSRDRIDKFSLGLDNTFQTKREGKSVDLLRSLLTTEFRLKDDPSKGSFGDVKWQNELTLNKYWAFYNDITYSNDFNHLQTANFELDVNSQKNWDFGISSRYAHKDDNILATQLAYTFNPKWRALIYDRWNVDTGNLQEQQYALVRDLHSWEVEFAYNTKQGVVDAGNEVWVIFRLKAFPRVKFNGASTTFNSAKFGSQSIAQPTLN